MNLLTLHRDEARHAFFEEHSSSPPFFDTAMGCWIVANPRHIEQLLLEPRLGPADYAGPYEQLTRKRGLPFPNIQFASRHLPFCLEGAEHQQSRRRVAGLLSLRRAAAVEEMEDFVDRAFSVFDRGGTVELMSEVIAPLVLHAIRSVADARFMGADDFMASAAFFDRMLGPKKRLQLESRLGAIRSKLRDSIDGISQDEEGVRLTLFLAGYETLLGTLGESVHWVLRQHQAARLCDVPFPDFPPQTGVPIIERRVAESFEFAGVRLSAGERLRFYLQAFTYGDEPKAGIFGLGPRTCLGKQLSLEAWRIVTGALMRKPTRFRILEYEARSDNYIFTCPKTLLLEAS